MCFSGVVLVTFKMAEHSRWESDGLESDIASVKQSKNFGRTNYMVGLKKWASPQTEQGRGSSNSDVKDDMVIYF